LVLTGGGARAAYQVGALQAIGELCAADTPFQVLVGASAGAINSAALASYAHDFKAGVAHLQETWRSLVPEKVYRTDPGSLMSIGLGWVRQLSAGALFGAPRVNALLDTSPLRTLLEQRLPMARIRQQVESGVLRGAAVTATSYHTGTAITFYDGSPEIEPWVRSSRLGARSRLEVGHVLASCAIPIFFPPVDLEGSWFGDGCVRLSAPLSPAIHLGAERVLAIGIRYARPPEETVAINQSDAHKNPSLSEIGGVLLNAVFLDSLDSDMERLERINATLSLLTDEQYARLKHRLRPIPLLALRPSRDLGRLAIEQYERFPRMLRHLLRGIGATGETGWDLVSYLAFEPAYIERLIELGYQDTLARRAEVEAFFAP
jgi:NTE family protein